MMRVRFAPSPTGFLHIGNARTALFNYLICRKHKGSYILRIEDTDKERSRKEFVDQIYEDLRWLGIDWDEGPDVGGDKGPYMQSQRYDIYRSYVQKLVDQGKAYACYLSIEELEEMRKNQAAQSKTIKFDRDYLVLSEEEIEARRKAGVTPSIRFRVNPGEIRFTDLIRGEVVFDAATLGDFVILRPDGSPTYHLSVTVDDGMMGITHVLRGEDHLSNTPKHILLLKAMGFAPPHYAHISLTVGQGGEPLSKRLGAMSIAEYRKLGYRSEALCNYMSLLGWAPGDDRELFRLDELIQAFSVERITKSPSVFDKTKLDWVAGNHIRQLPDEVYLEEALGFILKEKIIPKQAYTIKPEWFRGVLMIFKDNLSCYSQLRDRLRIFSDEFDYEDVSILKTETSCAVLDAALRALHQIEFLDEAGFDEVMKQIKKNSKAKGKDLFFPIRMALTGVLHGPELKQVMILLTKKGCEHRLERALETAKSPS